MPKEDVWYIFKQFALPFLIKLQRDALVLIRKSDRLWYKPDISMEDFCFQDDRGREKRSNAQDIFPNGCCPECMLNTTFIQFNRSRISLYPLWFEPSDLKITTFRKLKSFILVKAFRPDTQVWCNRTFPVYCILCTFSTHWRFRFVPGHFKSSW